MELIVGTKSDDFYVTMECGAEAEAKKLGVKLTVTGPATFSVPQQKPLIDAAEVGQAGRADRRPDRQPGAGPGPAQGPERAAPRSSSWTPRPRTPALGLSRISSNNAAGGKLAADQLAKLIGGKGTVAVINVAKGVSTTDARVAGLPAGDGGQVPEHQGARPSRMTTPTASAPRPPVVEGDITGAPDLNGVFAANVITAEGAATGIQHAGKSGKVKLATFDADTHPGHRPEERHLQLAIAQEPVARGRGRRGAGA